MKESSHVQWLSTSKRSESPVLPWHLGAAFAIAVCFPCLAAAETRAELAIGLREMMSFGPELPGLDRQFTTAHVDQCKLIFVREHRDDFCIPAKIQRSELEIDLNSVGNVTQREFKGMFAIGIYPQTLPQKNVENRAVTAAERLHYCDGNVVPGTVSEVVTLFVPFEGRQDLAASLTEYIQSYCHE